MNIVIWTGHDAQGLQVVPSSGHMIKHGALLGKRQALGHALFLLTDTSFHMHEHTSIRLWMPITKCTESYSP
jgi:hypothetical protein